jgi:hypothetical protein
MRGGSSAIVAAMPFIDDDLLWCPDNDGRMVDLSTCLENATNATNGQAGGEMASGSCDLSALDPLCNDSDELLRQLTENTFELDNFFNEFSAAEIKVRGFLV